ncbi:MAG: hypothetical protein WA080_05880 [Sulfuricurvum sp.]
MNLLFRLNQEDIFTLFNSAKKYFENLEKDNKGYFHATTRWLQIKDDEIVYFLWNENIVAKAKKGHYNYDKENINFPHAYELHELEVFDEGRQIDKERLTKKNTRTMTYLTSDDTAYLETL